MGLSPAQFLLRQVIQGRAASIGPSGPTAIFLSDDEVAEDATNGTLIGTLLTAGGTAPYTYSLTVDPDSLLAIDGDSLEVGDSFAGETTYTFTVRTTDANSLTFDQEFTLTVVEAIDNDSGIGSGDGEVIIPDPEDPETDEGGYEEPPIQQDTSAGLKIHGKNGGSATFLKDWGAPVPGAVYTMRYTADWSLMSRLGREAAIGFAFKDGNDFHLASLRGDGAVSTTMRESKVYGDFRKANQFTITNDGAADNGTKDGPNWLQIEISGDGATYTLRTSADGSSWADAYTAAVPTPLAAADDALQFGPGGYFTNQDKGVFSITIEEFDEFQPLLLAGSPVLTANFYGAYAGFTVEATGGTAPYTYSLVGDWPSGIVIDPETGVVSGAATEGGTFGDLSVRVTDDDSDTADLETFSLSVVDQHFASVVLLCGFDGTDGATSSTDASNSAHTLVFGGSSTAQLDTAQFKFGSASLLVDGNTGTINIITVADSLDWQLGTANSSPWTVECFVRFGTYASGNRGILGQNGVSGWFLTGTSTIGELAFGGSNFTTITTSGAGVTTGVWYHIAVDHDAAGKIRIYVDGVMRGSATPANSAIANVAADLGIGAQTAGGTVAMKGWLDEVRITKGVARYASDSGYTVPVAAYPRS